jgi:hypothetical protein
MTLFSHSCSDDLQGTSVYGTYEPSLTSNSSFSVPFSANASTPILFTSGDRCLYLAARYANFTTRTTDFGLTFNALHSSGSGLTDVGISFASLISASGTSLFRGPSNPTEPQVFSGMNVFYQESNATSNTTLLSKGGANVLLYNPTFCPRLLLCVSWALKLAAVCPNGCVFGSCASYNTCACDRGYMGPRCETRVYLSCLRMLTLKLCVELDAAL